MTASESPHLEERNSQKSGTHTRMYTALVRLLHKVTVEITFEKIYLENVVQCHALGARAGVRLLLR